MVADPRTEPAEQLEAHIYDAQVALGRGMEAAKACDLAGLLSALGSLSELKTSVAVFAQDLEHQAGEAMGDKRVTVDGVEWERSNPPKRSAWQTDDLLRAVLDSRLVDTETGEVKDETPLDRVLDVWNLPAPRTTALKARGIDADEFCQITWAEQRQWKVARVMDKKTRRGKQ